MKYANPLSIECPNCGESRKYPVEDLLNSQASCFSCNFSLASISKKMINDIADWKFMIDDLFEFLNVLEGQWSVQFEDKEIENLETFEDVFHLTQAKLTDGNCDEHLKQVILETAAQAGNYTVDQLTLEMSLVEVLEKR